jgi:hypothetical protein
LCNRKARSPSFTVRRNISFRNMTRLLRWPRGAAAKLCFVIEDVGSGRGFPSDTAGRGLSLCDERARAFAPPCEHGE